MNGSNTGVKKKEGEHQKNRQSPVSSGSISPQHSHQQPGATLQVKCRILLVEVHISASLCSEGWRMLFLVRNLVIWMVVFPEHPLLVLPPPFLGLLLGKSPLAESDTFEHLGTISQLHKCHIHSWFKLLN